MRIGVSIGPRGKRGIQAVAVVGGLTAGICALFLYAYGDCLAAFFHFDDFWVLGRVAAIEEGLPASWYRIFEPVHGFLLYRPLSTVAYFLALRLTFGNDPAGYHAVQLAFQVANSLLVFALACGVFRAYAPALAAALWYATAPALGIGACWNSLFTATGASCAIFVGVLVWMRWPGRWGRAVTLVCFVFALLASEHGVTFPLWLLASWRLLGSRWSEAGSRRLLALAIAVSVAYSAAKLAYLRWGLEWRFPDPAERAFVLHGYQPDWHPSIGLTAIGTYLGYAGAPLLFLTDLSAPWRLAVGSLLLLVAVGSVVWALRTEPEAMQVRAVAFGLTCFLASILPVAFLPRHVASYYATAGAAGVAIATAAIFSLSTPYRKIGATLLSVAVLGAFLGNQPKVQASEEFAFFRNFTWAAERWLHSVADIGSWGQVQRVVVPDSVLAQLVFEQGRAHQVLLCSPLELEVAKNLEDIPERPGQVILRQPFLYPRNEGRRRAWLPNRCAAPSLAPLPSPSARRGANGG